MEKWVEIRRLVKVEKRSKRSVCRQFGIHWDTLVKILGHTEPPGYRQGQPRAKRKIGPFLEIIDEILEGDKTVHRKQHHTARRIFDRLKHEYGYPGGYTAVKEIVRDRRLRQREVFMPLSHRPAEAQVDFGVADVIWEGHQCCVFPRECTEAFMEGHRLAFEFFGGVPKRISYDNSKIAVAKIIGKRERELTREFLRLKSHFLFKSHFCLVRRPNEKGQVEGLVGFTRRNFIVPMPHASSFEALNAELEGRCRHDLQRRLRGHSATKAELLEEERSALLAFPKQSYEARRIETAGADSLSLVRFDCNSYSVPTAYAQLDFARPLDGWNLPGCFDLLRRRLEVQLDHKGTREYIKVLRLLENTSISQLASAIRQTLAIGATSYDAVRVILQARQEEPVGLFSLDGRPHLKLVHVQSPDLDAYRVLVAGGAS